MAYNNLPLNETLANYDLKLVLNQAQELLQQFANRPDFTEKMQQAFGEDIDPTTWQETWASGNLGTLPEIKVLPSQDINGARGAFAAETNTIYLPQELLDGEDSNAVASVFLEEYGHYLDSQLSSGDAPGDEGEIFATFAKNNNLNQNQIEQIQIENDIGFVTLNGQQLPIEQNNHLSDYPPYFVASLNLPVVFDEESKQPLTAEEINETLITDDHQRESLVIVPDNINGDTVEVRANLEWESNLSEEEFGEVSITPSFQQGEISLSEPEGNRDLTLELQYEDDGERAGSLNEWRDASFSFATDVPNAFEESDPLFSDDFSAVLPDYEDIAELSETLDVIDAVYQQGVDAADKTTAAPLEDIQRGTREIAYWQARAGGVENSEILNQSRIDGISGFGDAIVEQAPEHFEDDLSREGLAIDISGPTVGIIDGTNYSITAINAEREEGDEGTTDFTFQVNRSGALPAVEDIGIRLLPLEGEDAASLVDNLSETVLETVEEQLPIPNPPAEEIISFLESLGLFDFELNQANESDFATTQARLSFEEGQDAETVSLEVAGDTQPEPDENFTVQFFELPDNGQIANVGDGLAGGTIINDDSDAENGFNRVPASTPTASERTVGEWGNSRAFAALKEDGSVVTWGQSDFGGDSSAVAEELDSGVAQIFSTRDAFSALKEDGSVVTWGDSDY